MNQILDSVQLVCEVLLRSQLLKVLQVEHRLSAAPLQYSLEQRI